MRTPSSHSRTIALLLATQVGGLALGLVLLYAVEGAVLDTQALEAASVRLASTARSLSQILSHAAPSNTSPGASVGALLSAAVERQRPLDRLPAGVAWLVVDRHDRVVAAGRSSDDVPAVDHLVDRPLSWSESPAAASTATATLPRLTIDGQTWIAAVEPIEGSPLRCVVAMPAGAIPVSIDSLRSTRLAICAIALLWTSVLQGIALYLAVTGTLEKLSQRNVMIEADNVRQAQALVRTRDALILGMATLAESRDDATGLHLDRVSAYATHLARILAREPEHLGEITPEFLELIGISAALHDIGKVGIEDAVLLKPGQLTTPEQHRMRQHTWIGGRCLEEIERRLGTSNFLEMVRQVVLSHHERWDGCGYPMGLAGTDIPLAARIVGLADVYDAMCSTRAYKNALSHEQAVEFIRSQSGIMFDPEIVEAFLRHEADFRDIAWHYVSAESVAPLTRAGLASSDRVGEAPQGALGLATDDPTPDSLSGGACAILDGNCDLASGCMTSSQPGDEMP